LIFLGLQTPLPPKHHVVAGVSAEIDRHAQESEMSFGIRLM
jgi:hypothetical protein